MENIKELLKKMELSDETKKKLIETGSEVAKQVLLSVTVGVLSHYVTKGATSILDKQILGNPLDPPTTE